MCEHESSRVNCQGLEGSERTIVESELRRAEHAKQTCNLIAANSKASSTLSSSVGKSVIK